MPRDITHIAREYCNRSRLIRRAVVAARARRLHMPTRVPAVDLMKSDARERFARAVIDRLDGTVLRYSMRLQLLDLGNCLGLSRFDACLIIAQVQHRAAGSSAPRPAIDRRAAFIVPPPAARASRLAPYVVAGILQLCIFAGAWAIVS